MVSDNIYGMKVEIIAIVCLTGIVLFGMYLDEQQIAAAAVGGIAGFISQKGLTDVANRSQSAKNTNPSGTGSSSPESVSDDDTA